MITENEIQALIASNPDIARAYAHALSNAKALVAEEARNLSGARLNFFDRSSLRIVTSRASRSAGEFARLVDAARGVVHVDAARANALANFYAVAKADAEAAMTASIAAMFNPATW
jgi:hypothetical protein